MGEGDLDVKVRLDGAIDERIELRVIERAPPGGEVGGRGIGRRDIGGRGLRRKPRRRVRRGGVLIRAGRAAGEGKNQREQPRSGELAYGATATHGSFPTVALRTAIMSFARGPSKVTLVTIATSLSSSPIVTFDP